MAAGDFYNLIIEYTFNETDIYRNVLAYKTIIGPITGTEQEALVDDWYAQCQSTFAAILPSSWAVVGVRSRGITDPLVGFDSTTRFNGTRSGQALPPYTTGIINFRTGLVGRRFQGRNQLPAPVETDQENGILSSGYIEDATDYGLSLEVLMDAGTGLIEHFQHVVYSKEEVDGTPVTAYLVRGKTGLQETRQTGRGR